MSKDTDLPEVLQSKFRSYSHKDLHEFLILGLVEAGGLVDFPNIRAESEFTMWMTNVTAYLMARRNHPEASHEELVEATIGIINDARASMAEQQKADRGEKKDV